MKKILKIFKNECYLLSYLINKGFFKKMDDELCLKIRYKASFDKKLNLESPSTFNEKIQWLKLYDRKKEYIKMVDKYEVKEYVANIIGDDYIIPTIGVYENFDDINFDELPNQFVIKSTNDSGGIVIVKNKQQLNINAVRRKINKSLKRNYYYCGREWPYKHVKPKIIIEKYMSNNDKELEDYKIHVFNGIPKLILVCKDRYKDSGLTEDFFDTQWNHLDIARPDHSNSSTAIVKPSNLDEMLLLSKKLAKDIPFVRVDFYIINNKVYFGEITFYPASGFNMFVPDKWDKILGSWINLPERK